MDPWIAGIIPFAITLIGVLLVWVLSKISICYESYYSAESEAQADTEEYFEPSAPSLDYGPIIYTYSVHSETNVPKSKSRSFDFDPPPSYSQIYSVNQNCSPSKSSDIEPTEPPSYFQINSKDKRLPIIYEINEEYL